MNNTNPKSWIWIGSLGVLLTLGGVGVRCFSGASGAAEVRAGARDVLSLEPGSKPDYSRLLSIRWPQIVPTLEGSCAQPSHAAAALAATATVAATNAPTLYLRGLVQLGQGDSSGALRTFQTIPVEAIPAAHLYAPYRLQGELRPTQNNPYRAPLVRAAKHGELPPLIAARVLAREADPQEALAHFVQSDPAAWTSYDLGLFPLLLRHAGLERDTRTMLFAALRGGRIKPEQRDAVRSLASEKAPTVASASFKTLLKSDPESRELAGRVAIHQLELRRKFLAREYGELLKDYAASDAVAQPDETVLLLTLSAARQLDRPALDRWSQELKRRNPQPEVDQWIKNLRIASR